MDMSLFYVKGVKSELFGYVDIDYLLNPHKARSKTWYMFTYGNTIILWWLIEQTMVAASLNCSEILAIHEVSRKYMWLKFVIQYIWESWGLSSIKDNLTILYDDNIACITQIKKGCIKGHKIKHILPKFSYIHKL